MSSIGHRLMAFALAGALSIGLSRSGVAQTAEKGSTHKDSVTVYRAKQPTEAPAAKPETKGRAPSADAVWVPGFWDLQGDPATAPHGGYVWVPGRWLTAPVPGARWDPAHWGWNDEWWSWIPGHWDQPERRK